MGTANGTAAEPTADDGGYAQQNAELGHIWRRRLAGPGDRLPGSTLQGFFMPGGWCGQVQLEDHATSDVVEASDVICDVYGVPRGALKVEPSCAGTADTAFLRAYSRPSAVDYYDREPYSVYLQNWAEETSAPDHLTRLERNELSKWTREYVTTLQLTLKGQGLDIETLVRRYERMRGGIIDALHRAGAAEVIALLTEAGMTRAAMPHDLARKMNWRN